MIELPPKRYEALVDWRPPWYQNFDRAALKEMMANFKFVDIQPIIIPVRTFTL